MCNVGLIDQLLRILLGLEILSIGLVFESWLSVIGIIPMISAILAFCPLYVPIGFNTRVKRA